jgi:hypothetical protein
MVKSTIFSANNHQYVLTLTADFNTGVCSTVITSLEGEQTCEALNLTKGEEDNSCALLVDSVHICPKCHHNGQYANNGYLCPNCGNEWPV